MTERDHEFATPALPETLVEPPSQRMTNADFRKMMMTPRAGSGAKTSLLTSPALGSGHLPFASPSVRSESKAVNRETSERAEKRKKKKSYYAKLKREEDDKMAELAAKYRDRAAERRDGGVPGAPSEGANLGGARTETEDSDNTGGAGASNTSGYRAVAPDVKSSFDAAERRKRMIQESKFLGGDMEHTHLVKGLDFALLQKVRSEISTRETAEEEEIDEEAEANEIKALKKKEEKEKEVENEEDKVMCRTPLAKNILRVAFKTDIPERNELFFPGRMAYVIDLEEEGEVVNDIPTTTIRSKADVAGNVAHQQASTLSTNDIVINKLTQILSYLRAGSRNKKKKKEKLGNLGTTHGDNDGKHASTSDQKLDDIPLYDDVGDYVPTLKRDEKRRGGGGDDRRHRDRERDRNRGDRRDEDRGRRNYFDKDAREAEEEHQKGFSNQDKEIIKTLIKREEEKSKRAETKMGQMLTAKEPEGYAECYPGMSEMADAIDDSDDEADYSKMDLGNKKGPVGRWDFDTPDEYADYMSKKEALPKAAFQYGVKMSEGRKTRGKVGKGNEKAKLDKEWNQISALLDKRKSGSGGGGSEAKRAKM